MSEIQKLKSFIDSLQYHERSGPSNGSKTGRFPFVTISRQTGAGGQVLSAELLKQINELSREALFTGWQLCNQELCHSLSQDPGLKVAIESLLRKEYCSHTEDMLGQLIFGNPSQDVVVKKMFQVMRTFALHGKVIFVGRGSVFLTRDLPWGIHVRLVASLDSRIKRVMSSTGVTEKKARETIAEKDEAKAELVKTFFNKDIRDPLLYDIVWNTDRVPLHEIARILIERIRMKGVEAHEFLISQNGSGQQREQGGV